MTDNRSDAWIILICGFLFFCSVMVALVTGSTGAGLVVLAFAIILESSDWKARFPPRDSRK